MNFETTTELLEALEPYISGIQLHISCDNKDWENRDYKSDCVTIDKKNKVGFEVFQNEIIVFYFTDHYHFEDYAVPVDEGEDDYVKRAKEFLLDLFTYKICHIEYFKGQKMYSEKYYMMYDDGREDEYIGGTIWSIWKSITPFGKKSEKRTVWSFDRAKGCFTSRDTEKPDEEAVEYFDISEDCYVEIFYRNNAYTYNVMAIDYDEYYCRYYWAPARNVVAPGWYDTKERAIEEAKRIMNYGDYKEYTI